MKKRSKVGYGHGTSKKCVRGRDGKVVYVKNSEAARIVAGGGSYVPRKVWKEEVRDFKETKEPEVSKRKSKKKN